MTRWHIRPLTQVGRKLGGGADTPALCGRTVSWDLKLVVDSETVEDRVCPLCRAIWKDRQ